MNYKKTRSRSKRSTYLLLLVAISVLTIVVSTLINLATYPTSEHQRVQRELSSLNLKAYGQSDQAETDKILKSDTFYALTNSPQNKYTKAVGISTSVIEFAISITILILMYRYFRREHITKKPVSATVWISVVSYVITVIPISFILQSLNLGGTQTVEGINDMTLILYTLPLTAVFYGLVTLLIVKIIEWHYNRSHGFIEE